MKIKLLIQCTLFVTAIIAFILFITTPVLTTQDDTFIQYVLSSGFTQTTIHVTYFEYGFLTYEKLFAWLYKIIPHFNWLTVFYVLLHGISAVVISYLLAAQKKYFFIVGYIILFFVPLIMNVSFTTTAAHAMVAGFIVCVFIIQKQKVPSYYFILLLGGWFIIALLLRVHIVFPLLLIFLPFILLIRRQIIVKRFFILLILVAVVIANAFTMHEKYYSEAIPRWQNIKATTTSFYELANKGYDINKIKEVAVDKQRANFNMIKNRFLYDDILLNAETLTAMQQATKYQNKWRNLNAGSVYFLLTDIKQYLLVLAVMMILLFRGNIQKKYRNAFLISVGITVFISLYLLIFMRFPERVWSGFFLLLYLLAAMILPSVKNLQLSKLQSSIVKIFVAAAFIIQSVYFFKLARYNSRQSDQFECAASYVESHSETLFVEYAESFPFNHFPAFVSPARYPLGNVLFPFYFNTELRYNLLKKFSIQNLNQAIISSHKIILIGKPDEELKQYLELNLHKKISFEKITAPSACMNLFTVTAE
jgi:hypothetical protein